MNRWKLKRLERGETISAFARRCGVAPLTVSNFERGQAPSFASTIRALADGYGVTVRELLDTEEREAA